MARKTRSILWEAGRAWGAAGMVFICALTGCLPSEKAAEQNPEKKIEKGESASASPREIDPRLLEKRAFHEAPMLAEKVEKGELPAVVERLPDNPLVLAPVQRPGKYGGTIRRALIADIVDQTAIAKSLSENLMAYERPSLGRILPNLAESYAFEEGGRGVVFKLRKGTRWSDGVPFTADDILFWYEDVALNENARNAPVFPSIWLNAGKPVKLEKRGPYTLRISSEKPLGMILNTLCYDDLALPKHYFSRFHPKYNKNATYDDFRKRTTLSRLAYEPGTPRLSAWYPVSWVRGQRAVLERNPYYWKIDNAGNQLPYVDRLVFTVIPNINVMLLKFFNGELDLFGRYFGFSMYQTMKEEERKERFSVFLVEPRPYWAFYLNWEVPRPALREAFRNRKVRIALSYGMNREEINSLVFSGLLKPAGVSLSPASPFYSEAVVSRYAQYDPEKARALLEEAGYEDTDGDGIRELKDGSAFALTIDILSDTELPDLCELLAKQWEGIGVRTHLNIALQEIIGPRRVNGNFEVAVYRAPTDPFISSELVSITGPNEPFWYRTAKNDAPPWLREFTAFIEEAKTTFDPDERHAKMDRIRNLYAEEIPFLYLGEVRGVWAASNRLGNLPRGIHGDNYARDWDRAILSEQLYFKR